MHTFFEVFDIYIVIRMFVFDFCFILPAPLELSVIHPAKEVKKFFFWGIEFMAFQVMVFTVDPITYSGILNFFCYFAYKYIALKS